MQEYSSVPQSFDDFSLNLQLKVLGIINAKKNLHDFKKNIFQKQNHPFSMDELIKYILDLIESSIRGREEIVINDSDAPLKYAFAAWADEIIIRNFRDNDDFKYLGIVEYHLFGTRESGEKIFQHINYILDNEIVCDLALIYRKMIALGYRGYLYQRDDDDDRMNISYLYSDLCQITQGANETVYKPEYIKERQILSLIKDGFNYKLLAYIVTFTSIILISILCSNNHWSNTYINLNRYANDLMMKYQDTKVGNDV